MPLVVSEVATGWLCATTPFRSHIFLLTPASRTLVVSASYTNRIHPNIVASCPKNWRHFFWWHLSPEEINLSHCFQKENVTRPDSEGNYLGLLSFLCEWAWCTESWTLCSQFVSETSMFLSPVLERCCLVYITILCFSSSQTSSEYILWEV